MARVSRAFPHARRLETLRRKPLRAADWAQEPEKGSKFDAKAKARAFFFPFFPPSASKPRPLFFFLRLLASGHFFSEKSTAKKKIKSEKTEEKNRCAPLSVSCLFRSVCFASLSASEGGLRAALLFADRKREKEKRSSKRESKEKRERERERLNSKPTPPPRLLSSRSLSFSLPSSRALSLSPRGASSGQAYSRCREGLGVHAR